MEDSRSTSAKEEIDFTPNGVITMIIFSDKDEFRLPNCCFISKISCCAYLPNLQNGSQIFCESTQDSLSCLFFSVSRSNSLADVGFHGFFFVDILKHMTSSIPC